MTKCRLAVLLTCHNRKQKTLNCLAALFENALPEGVELQVYLVDDGSTDGTSEVIRQLYPTVFLLEGNGSLYWNGGMRVAFAEAMKHCYDYYLWLNDDTNLYPGAIKTLITTAQLLVDMGNEAIVVGSTCDPETGSLTYGGMTQRSWWHPFQFNLVEPSEQPKPCDTINGNCVLIHHKVVEILGNLDPAFSHGTGDTDYGLRAKRHGITNWVAPGYLGTCSENKWRGSLEDNISLQERLKRLKNPKEFSLRERRVMAQRYGGILWPIFWLLPFMKWLIPFQERANN